MKQVFSIKEAKRYPTKNIFETRNIHTTDYGSDSLAHLGPKIWGIIPKDLKDIKSLDLFKKKIKLWTPHNCPCKLCKTYIRFVGYVD